MDFHSRGLIIQVSNNKGKVKVKSKKRDIHKALAKKHDKRPADF